MSAAGPTPICQFTKPCIATHARLELGCCHQGNYAANGDPYHAPRMQWLGKVGMPDNGTAIVIDKCQPVLDAASDFLNIRVFVTAFLLKPTVMPQSQM